MTALDHMLNQLPSGEAHACLWTESAGHVRPVLVLEQAAVIADHLVEWAEGDPGAWFRLAIGQHRGRYALALLPDLIRSRERFTLARRLAGLPVPGDVEYCYVYGPLRFVSGPEHTYTSVHRRLPSRITLGVLDRAEWIPFTGRVDVQRIRSLGPFPVATDQEAGAVRPRPHRKSDRLTHPFQTHPVMSWDSRARHSSPWRRPPLHGLRVPSVLREPGA